jgi:hypothetical protein
MNTVRHLNALRCTFITAVCVFILIGNCTSYRHTRFQIISYKLLLHVNEAMYYWTNKNSHSGIENIEGNRSTVESVINNSNLDRTIACIIQATILLKSQIKAYMFQCFPVKSQKLHAQHVNRHKECSLLYYSRYSRSID